MRPYRLFKTIQGSLGRRYRGDIDKFESSKYYSFFYNLSKSLKTKIGSDVDQRRYINFCATNFGDLYDPFQLDSDEYIEKYKNWNHKNKDYQSYKKDVANSLDFIFTFCKKHDIFDIQQYTKQWGFTHYVAGKINNNVAFFIGLHKINMSTPEKKILRKFLNQISIIQDRMKRERNFRKFMETSIVNLEDRLQSIRKRTQAK